MTSSLVIPCEDLGFCPWEVPGALLSAPGRVKKSVCSTRLLAGVGRGTRVALRSGVGCLVGLCRGGGVVPGPCRAAWCILPSRPPSLPPPSQPPSPEAAEFGAVGSRGGETEKLGTQLFGSSRF